MKKFIYTIILLVIIGTVNLCIIHKKNDNNSDAKYVEIINEYILNDNGSIDFIHHHKVKLNTYYAIRHLGDDRIIYNPKYQKIEILKSETKMNDGTIVETPENGFNEVLPRCATKAPSYNHLREMVVTHTGLDLGSTIDFTYSLHAEKEFLPALMGEEIFSTFYPVGKMIVKITVPTEKTMNYKMFNSTKKVKIKEDDNTKTYIWKFKNIPAVIHENNQSEIGNFSPRLVFSTLESWENLAEYLKIMSDKSMKNDEKLKSNIEKDLSKKDDDLLKIIELQKKINENIGLTNCSPLTYGYKPKSISKTFNENNGTALDKSLLLVTYLKLSDIDATPVFISKYNEFAKEVPSLFQFDNFLISHKDTTEVIYIIPNHEQTNNYKFNIENKTVFDFNNISKPLTKIEKDNKNQNFQILNLNLNIKDDLTLTGDYELNYSGVFNPYFTLFEDEKNAESNAKKIINGTIENSEIVKMNQKKSV
ncbi:MAG: DUF3857 domain-containing protein, partial [Candidatus Marinimicrobia bacterium]|nr:DUF3857 domain-containing protein [Candidatus Neomarinimicrobiota bacterium]